MYRLRWADRSSGPYSAHEQMLQMSRGRCATAHHLFPPIPLAPAHGWTSVCHAAFPARPTILHLSKLAARPTAGHGTNNGAQRLPGAAPQPSNCGDAPTWPVPSTLRSECFVRKGGPRSATVLVSFRGSKRPKTAKLQIYLSFCPDFWTRN